MSRTIMPAKYGTREVLCLVLELGNFNEQDPSLESNGDRRTCGWAWVDISPSNLSNEQFPQIQRKIS